MGSEIRLSSSNNSKTTSNESSQQDPGLHNLPIEIYIDEIFKKLNFNDICSLSLVDKTFYRITSSEDLWQKKLGENDLEKIQDFTSKQSYMFKTLLKNTYPKIVNIFDNNFPKKDQYHLQLTLIKIYLKLDLIEDALYLIEEAINYLKNFEIGQDTYINKARCLIAEKLFTLKRDQEAIALLYNIKAPYQSELLSIIKISKDKKQIEKAKSYYLSKIENAQPISKMNHLLRLIEICKEIGDTEFVENSFNEIKKLQDQVSFPQNLADLQVQIMKIYPNLEEIQKAKSLISETKNISDKIQAQLNFIEIFPEKEEIENLKVIIENLNPNPEFLSFEFINKKIALIGIIKAYLRLGEIQKAKDCLTECNKEILIEANLEIIKNCKDKAEIEKTKKYIIGLSENRTDYIEIQLELTKLYPSFEEIIKIEKIINEMNPSKYKVKTQLELISILIMHREILFKKI